MTRLALVLAISACMVGDEDSAPDDDHDVVDLSSALLVSSRDHLHVCVQVDPVLAAQTDVLVARILDDLGWLRAHPDWNAAKLGDVAVDAGCPGGATVAGPIDAKGTGGVVLGPGVTTTPSPYRLHIHIVADARAASVLGSEPYARALAELVAIDDHRVAEVSTALVVRASALGTDGFRYQALADGIGLAPL